MKNLGKGGQLGTQIGLYPDHMSNPVPGSDSRWRIVEAFYKEGAPQRLSYQQLGVFLQESCSRIPLVCPVHNPLNEMSGSLWQGLARQITDASQGSIDLTREATEPEVLPLLIRISSQLAVVLQSSTKTHE